MAYLTFRSAGESHGRGCFAFIEGFPFGVPIDQDAINHELARRQKGYGRGGRMKIETDKAEFLSGVRHNRTMGAPIIMAVWNKDCRIETAPELDCPRPGHADLVGHLKFDAPIRDILERASARETAARVAAGALCRLLLKHFGIQIRSHVVALGPVELPAGFKPTWEQLEKADASEVRCLDKATEEKMIFSIDQAKKAGDTLGGIFEVVVQGLPIGLGDHTQWDRRLDGRIAQAMMSIQAMKGVEIGLGFAASRLPGSQVHDEINYKPTRTPTATGGFTRPTNGAGGLEGGITNGAPLVVRVAMKPISTLMKPLMSVDLTTGEPMKADIERSDYCALPAAAVVGENFMAFILAQALCEKFGGDSLQEMLLNYKTYREQISRIRKSRDEKAETKGPHAEGDKE
ncbi:MAG TPA: chorismate synthase [Planctomycetota bacterium]|nr:chorismate synthase [Planctomycetota bacterium]